MSIFSTAGGRPVPISDAALAEAFRSASVHDEDNEQNDPKLLLAQDLEHDCYELAKNEAFLKKRADRDENSPTASTQTTKKIRPTFRPASVLLRNESMVSSSLASSASPRSLCFDLAEESIEAVGKEDANNTIFAPRSGKEAEEVKEEDKEDHELLNNFCEDELFVESHFLAAAKLMLEFEEDA